MALERRLLLPVVIVFLLTFLFLSSFRTNSGESTLWDTEGLIPYEQEYEQAGPLTPYIPPSLPIKENLKELKQVEEEGDVIDYIPKSNKEEINNNNNNKIKQDSSYYTGEDYPLTSPKEKEYFPELNSLPSIAQDRPIPKKSTNKDAIVINLSTSTWSAPSTPPRTGRYLSYIAHSGFHNQRIAFVNALTLAQLLDRTLLVSPATLGKAVDWAPTPLLQEHVEQAENSDIEACRKIKDKSVRKATCGNFWYSRRVSWSWLLDAKSLANIHELIDRPHHRKDWYWETLGIKNSDIKTYEDLNRHSYRFFENIDMPDLIQGDYTDRINIDELKTSTDGYKLLEFGSLYGSTRIILETNDKKLIFEKLMAFKQPILEKISEAVVERLGGRNNFVGLHLRVGQGDKFDLEARERTAGVFKSLLKNGYGLDDTTANNLLAKNSPDSTRPSFVPSTLEKPFLNSKTFYPTKHLACPSILYPSNSLLVSLNIPLYIATDSTKASIDPLLNVFRNTFPCIFYLSDFHSISNQNLLILPEMLNLLNYVDEFAEPLAKFLAPFVDAEIAAKARTITGTPGSTFSNYVKSTLYQSYRSTSSQINEDIRTFISKGSFGIDVAVKNVGKPITKGKGTDREEMLAAEKEMVKKPTSDDEEEEEEVVEEKSIGKVSSSSTKGSSKVSTGGDKDKDKDKDLEVKVGSALKLSKEDKSGGNDKFPPTKTPTKTEEEVVVVGGVLPDQMEEEMEEDLEEASKGKYLDKEEIKLKMKQDKLALEKENSIPLMKGELAKNLEVEVEKSSEGKFIDEIVPIEGPLDLGGEIKQELKAAEEEKFSDKVVVVAVGGGKQKDLIKTPKEEIKEATKELMEAKEDKYDTKNDVKNEVVKIKKVSKVVDSKKVEEFKKPIIKVEDEYQDDDELKKTEIQVEEIKGKNRLSSSDQAKLNSDENKLDELFENAVIPEGDVEDEEESAGVEGM